jgi:YbbR domain-containing protein
LSRPLSLQGQFRLFGDVVVAWIRSPLSRNPGIKLLSLLLATGLWLYVQGEQVMEANTLASVEYSWPDGLALSEPAPPQVRLTASGARALVKRLEGRDLHVVVDMSEATAGVQSVEFLGREIKGLPKGVSVVSTAPSSIQVELVASVMRQIKVMPATVGKVAEGYHLVDVTLDPSLVEVRGPATVLERLRSLHTDGISIDGLRKSTTLEVGLNVERGLLVEVGDETISARVQVEPDTESRNFSNVPVLMTDADRRWRSQVDQVEVTLKGPIESIRAISAEHVAVVVRLPKNIPASQQSVVVGPESDASIRYEVLRPGADVEVVSVVPQRFVIERRR